MKTNELFLAGLVLAFIGIGVQIAFAETGTFVGGILSTVGIIIALRSYLIQKNPDRVKKDERSRKIGAYSASYSWVITILVLMGLFWVNKLVLPLSVDVVIGLTYIVMVGAVIFFKAYLDKKGDVE